MHISEGVLSGPVIISGAAAALAGTAVGLRKLDYEQMVHVAILASAFFVASLIHVNIGPASTHLVLNGIVGLILGFSAFPAIMTALILQAVLFGFGGLTTLGVNVVIMAAPAVAVHYLFLPLVGKSARMTYLAGAMAGGFAVLLSSILMAASLWMTDQDFLVTSRLIVLANIPVMIIEGIVSGFCLAFLVKVYPEIVPGKTLKQ